MTNPNHSYHFKQEDPIPPILFKSAAFDQSTILEGDSTAPNSESSSPLSFNQINMNMSNSNQNIAATTNGDSWGTMPSTHDYPQPELENRCNNSSFNNMSSNHSEKFSRGPLSPQSAPPTTSIPGGWASASASNTPVPSVIHTEANGDGEPSMTYIKAYGSTPSFPLIDRSSSGNMSMGSASSSSNLLAKRITAKATGKKKYQTSKLKKSGSNTILTQSTNSPRPQDIGSSSNAVGPPRTGKQKQRRLERNRLSAQLSRRRRKHYLGELETRVVKLSLDMDAGRRAHAFQAIDRISEMRRQVLASAEAHVLGIERSRGNDTNDHSSINEREAKMHQFHLENLLKILEEAGHLSRTNNDELLILNSFLGQQLKSFSLPSHSKFILWLTLQGDIFFRGGRAASERLSAARIGEKMLGSGTDKVTPANAMWPLICNEVGLSYELEERLRVYQRTTILQDKTTWLDRHTARSSALVMQSYHDTVGGMAQMVGRRESEMTQRILTPSQRVKLLAWADKNSARIKDRLEARRKRSVQQQQHLMKTKTEELDIGFYVDSNYSLNKSHHLAANLYILNHQLQRILKDFPYQSPSALTAAVLKKLMRRASFESLGQQKDTDSRSMSRDDSFVSMKSFASSGSLMSASNLSLGGPNDSERPVTLNQLTPQVGEHAAVEVVDQAIGFVKPIIPPIPKPMMSVQPAVHVSAPTSNSTIGSSQMQDMKAAMAMDYHNHNLAPTAVSSYVSPAPLASVPPSNQHGQPVPHLAMHHAPSPPPPQLNVHNYSAPSHLTYQSSQVHENYQQPQQAQAQSQVHKNYQQPQQAQAQSQVHENYQQPQQPQAQHYYPPQQHVQYPPPMMGSPHGQPIASVEHNSIGPVYETSPSVMQQQQPPVVRKGHVRKSSFLPPHLNAVPEDMFPCVEGTAADFFDLEDCLMGEGDEWNIGVGLDMDTTG